MVLLYHRQSSFGNILLKLSCEVVDGSGKAALGNLPMIEDYDAIPRSECFPGGHGVHVQSGVDFTQILAIMFLEHTHVFEVYDRVVDLTVEGDVDEVSKSGVEEEVVKDGIKSNIMIAKICKG